MVNRYITALLIVLAATGVEAQTYKSALKLALTDISYDEFIQQPEIKALEDDILSVIKAIKLADENYTKNHNPNFHQALFYNNTYYSKCNIECYDLPQRAIALIPHRFSGSLIVIRGPNVN